eukprot:m.57691 g.57691  ORF g.57691 m.57691 type:complete len:235 (-) comp13102_c1_seq1:364-1068(-)
MSLYEGLGLDIAEISPFAAVDAKDKDNGDDADSQAKKKKTSAEGWSVSQSMFAAQLRRKQAAKAREKAAESAKKKSENGSSVSNSGITEAMLAKPLVGYVETTTTITRKQDLNSEDTSAQPGASTQTHSTGGRGGATNNPNSETGYEQRNQQKSNTGEPFAEDPLAYRDIHNAYSPWRPNDFELVRMKKNERNEEGRREPERRRRRVVLNKATIAPPARFDRDSPPPERPSFAY